MNLQLSDEHIRSTCRDLVEKHGRVSGRRLCEELRRRFGAVGKTMRVFRIWREECVPPVGIQSGPAFAVASASQLPGEMALLQRRVELAEAAAAEYLKRAELAEFRERAHQDHWALEVDRLRQEIAALKGPTKPFPV
jgi:hypothetical protein